MEIPDVFEYDRAKTAAADTPHYHRRMIWNVISFVLLGLFAGAIARLLVPGKDSLGFWATGVLGMIGSFVGGFLGYLIGHDKGEGGLQVSGIFGSVIGAVIVLLIYRKIGGDRLSKR